MSAPSNRERLEELLADEVVFGLEGAELNELEGLAADEQLATGFDLAAATYYLAAAPLDAESMPASVRASVLNRLKPGAAPAVTDDPPNAGGRRSAWWALALAASLAVGVFLGQGLTGGSTAPPLAQQVAALLEIDPAATQLAWAALDDPSLAEGAKGGVVWSDAEQRGFMTFEGLAANDPTVEQYQLWIFDADRDDKYPVDGGVFDIPPGGGEVVVPIDAKIDVNQAVMFAITVEKPGGVVVSDRSRLPLLAKAD